MTFDDFVEQTRTWLTKYLTLVSAQQKAGIITLPTGESILYPSILLVTNTQGYYVAELIGAVRAFNGLQIKTHKEPSIYRYINQFTYNHTSGFFGLDDAEIGLSHLALSNSVKSYSGETDLDKRFSHIDRYGSKLSMSDENGSLFIFGKKFISCFLEDCLFINRHNNIYRCKSILLMFITSSDVSEKQLSSLFNSASKDRIRGVHVANEDTESKIVAGQLQSMYLTPSLQETTIGEFIKLHPAVVKKAFSADDFLYEPTLKWIKQLDKPEGTAINPELLVKRKDGFYDIYDLKTALLSKKSLTKAGKSRRRFIDSVNEGVAQLANYEEYFTITENAEFAEKEYGIKVQNPNLVLIIGSFDNAGPEEIRQASRALKKNTAVIDYDTLCQMFLLSK